MNRLSFLMIVMCFFLGFYSNGQNEEMPDEVLERYYSDDIKVGEFSEAMYDSLEYGNSIQPVTFFMMSNGFIQDSMLNEAAVLFLVGRYRYKLYNKTDPNYELTGGGALAVSLASSYSSYFNRYLNKNLENYGEIVRTCGKWYEENKHFYFDHPDNDSLYQSQVDGFHELADLLLNNPEEYVDKLETKRKKREEEMEELKRQLEKQLEERLEEMDIDEE